MLRLMKKMVLKPRTGKKAKLSEFAERTNSPNIPNLHLKSESDMMGFTRLSNIGHKKEKLD